MASWVPETDTTPKESLTERGKAIPLAPLFEPSHILAPLSRAKTLACIAYLDTVRPGLKPKHFEQTLAISSENPIYVEGVILADSFSRGHSGDVNRIVGNIGRTGICMLVAPKELRIKPVTDTFNVVNQRPYDLKRENDFL